MSDSTRIQGDRVYCHVCAHEWMRSQGGLQCPNCESEFVEVMEASPPREEEHAPPIPPRPSSFTNPFNDHNPWAPDPEEDDITSFGFNTGRSRGTFTFTSRTYTFGGNQAHRDPAAEEITRNFAAMFSTMLPNRANHPPMPMMNGGMFPFPPTHDRGFGQHPAHPVDPFHSIFLGSQPNAGGRQAPANPILDILGMLFNPGGAQRGDMVMSEEELQQVMTRLMDQSQGNGAPPAAESAIRALEKKEVNKEMLGSDGKAECSICMDNVEIGDEVTFLPCNHWFHGECVISWLKEHDTCPHCRKPITNSAETNQERRPSSSRRRIRRRSTANSPINELGPNETPRYGPQTADGIPEPFQPRNRFYGNTAERDLERSNSERRSSSRSNRDTNNSGGSGVGGWIRSLRPFS